MDLDKLLALLKGAPNTNAKQIAWREYVIKRDIEMARAMGEELEKVKNGKQ